MSTPNPLLDIACAAFPTLEQIKTQLGIEDTSQDEALTVTMKGTLTLIEDYLGRGIVQLSRVQTFSPPDTRDSKLFLSRFPVQSVEGVTVDGSPLAAGWRVFGPEGILELGQGCHWRGPQGCCEPGSVIAVDYTAGYPQDCWPPSLLDAVMRTFFGRWNATGGDAASIVAGGAVKSWSADGLSISMGDASAGLGSISTNTIPPDLINVAAQLDPYRLRFVRGA